VVEPAASRGRWSGAARAALPTLVVVAAQTALALSIYRHTLQLSFLSDPWVYLWRLRGGLWSMLKEPIGYHYQPVAYAWLAAIRWLFGESAEAFQAVNIAQLVVFGYLTYELGKRLLPHPGLGFLASLLVVGNAAFYEAAYWPFSGNAHLLASQLYVLAIILAHDAGSGALPKSGPWLVGAAAMSATFCHPAMITVLPVCAFTFAAARGLRVPDSRAAWATTFKMGAAFAVVVVLFAISRLAFASFVDLGPQAGLDPLRAYWFVTRGLVAVFSLRGSHDVVHRLTTLGASAGFEHGSVWPYVWGWMAVAAIAGVVCVVRGTSGVRVLVVMLGVHLTIVSIAAGFPSRQSQVPAVPAALLTVWALSTVARRLSRIQTGPSAAIVFGQIPAVGVLLLVASARPDHQTAADVYLRASQAVRSLSAQLRTVPWTTTFKLTLVNLPAYMSERNIGAPTFSNGTVELVRFNAPSISTVDLCWLSDQRDAGAFANNSRRIEVDELRERLKEPTNVVMFYQEPIGVQFLTLDRIDSVVFR
jgi:hypothetical protein